MVMIVEQLAELMNDRKTEVLGEDLCRSVLHRSHMISLGLERGPLRWEAGEYQP
jgi:hypothetical protein